MRHLRKRASSAIALGSPKIRMQPGYNTEVSDAYLEAMQKAVDEKKPANFSLVPLSDAGW